MSLRKRVQILLGVFAAILVAVLLVDIRLMAERSRLTGDVGRRLEPAQDALGEVSQGLVDQETAERGFVIAHDESFLGPFYSGRQRVDDGLAELHELLGSDPALAAAVQRLQGRVSAWRQLGADYEIAAVRAGRFDEATALVRSGTGRRLFDAARAEVGGLRRDLVAERQRADGRIDDVRATLSGFTVAGAVLGLGLLAVGAWLLRRWVTRPLQLLRSSVRAVAAGDLGREIQAAGPPELASLADDVEAMRQRILVEGDDASRARHALGQRGLVVLSLSEQLRPDTSRLPPGLRLAARFAPAEGVVAGDWWDIVPLGPSRAAIVVVDVSGHGAEAGVFALRTKDLTLAALESGYGPGEALTWVAARLGDTDERFLTGVILEIDDIAGVLRYASAGHPPLLVAERGSVQTLGLTGPLLGPMLDAQRWATVEVPLGPSAVVVACSDGVLEARDLRGEEFGIDRLATVLRQPALLDDVEAVADRCLGALDVFGVTDRHDDLTLVVLGRSGQPAVPRPPATASAT